MDQNIDHKPDQQIKNQLQFRCNLDANQMQSGDNCDTIRCIKNVIQMPNSDVG